MSRNDLLEEKGFEPVRSILNDLYGGKFENASITPVDGGGFSHGFILSTSDDESLFFKLSSPAGESAKDEYAKSPLEFMEFLSEKGVNVPTPLRDRNGDISSKIDTTILPNNVADSIGKHRAILMTLAEGNTIPNQVIENSQGRTYFDYADQVGAAVGKFHSAQDDEKFQGTVPDNQGEFDIIKAQLLKTFGFDQDISAEQLYSELQNPDSSASQTISSISETLKQNSHITNITENRDTILQMAQAIDNGLFHDIVAQMVTMESKQSDIVSLPQGTAHGDMTTGNFMETEGKITAIIDFDEIFNGALLWDVAELMVNNFAITDTKSLDSEFQADAAKKTLEAYETERPLSSQEIDLLSDLVAERELTYFSRRVEAISDVMQSNELTQEQLDAPLPRFEAIMMPYRQLEKIDEVEDMLTTYKTERQGMDSSQELIDQPLKLPQDDIATLKNITQTLEKAGVEEAFPDTSSSQINTAQHHQNHKDNNERSM